MDMIAVADLEVGAFYEINLPHFQKTKTVRREFGGCKFSPIITTSGQSSGSAKLLAFPDAKGGSEITAMWMANEEVLQVKPIAKPPFQFRIGPTYHRVQRTGCDPEIFVVDGRHRLIPAFDFLPSAHMSKMHRFSSKPRETGIPYGYPVSTGKAYWDGFQAEFTTEPMTCHGYLFDFIRDGLRKIHEEAVKHNPKARLSLKSVFRIPQGILQTAADEHVNLGCDPSGNAYGAEPFRAENPRELPYRVAGGHIHFGLVDNTNKSIIGIVKALDFLLAIPAVGIFADFDDPLRRQFYGRAGEYRQPSYGVEYRVLSNAWLGHPAVGHLVFDIARQAVGVGSLPIPYEDFGLSERGVQDIINNCDVKAARKLVDQHSAIWHTLFRKVGAWGTTPRCTDNFFKAVQSGIESVVPDFRNVEANWHLDDTWMIHTNDMAASWGRLGR